MDVPDVDDVTPVERSRRNSPLNCNEKGPPARGASRRRTPQVGLSDDDKSCRKLMNPMRINNYTHESIQGR